MNPAPKPIPAELLGAVFTAAQAAHCGVSKTMLRGERFVRVHHGVYTTKQTATPAARYVEGHVAQQAQHYAPRLRQGEAFSHTTALLLFGAPIVAPDTVHVTVNRPAAPTRSKGVQGHRSRVQFSAAMPRAGLWCVPPELALVQAATLPFRELVVAIDHLILPRRSLEGRAHVELDRLSACVASMVGPGINRVRAACQVARVGAESRYETLTRFELARMGLDDLELQANLYRADGTWFGRFDMASRARRKIVEFDGEQHRTDRRQCLKDVRRLEVAREERYDVLRLHAEDFAPSALAHTRRKLCEFLGEQPRAVPSHLRALFAEPYLPCRNG